ncbi:uncharacterized protein LOC131849081 [Achroia grisella]|uniref:uncharacterized protein LOC131849081 n=1 Tax=Achroia grisella TaxID=688607 RepID=UPI0027D336DB|nr:uncharacterized protein LOC131849081 [Achroia grisella]
MGIKFLVYACGRWREVRLDGRVCGWGGRPRFMRMKRGKLCLVSQAAVLRGLRALAAGQPTTITDGPPLPHLRHDPHAKEPPSPKREHVHGCCHAAQCCRGTNAHKQPPSVREVSSATTQPASVEPATTETSTKPASTEPAAPLAVSSGNNIDSTPHLAKDTVTTSDKQTETTKSRGANKSENTKTASPQKKSSGNRGRKRRRSTSSSSTAGGGLEEVVRRRQPKRKVVVASSDSEPTPPPYTTQDSSAEGGDASYKEVTIDLEDLQMLRDFLERDNVWGVDLHEYDTSENYKMKVLFNITPLVMVARCPRIAEMLRRGAPRLDSFAARLGLQRRRGDSDGDKENRLATRGRGQLSRNGSSRTAAKHTDDEGDVQDKIKNRLRPSTTANKKDAHNNSDRAGRSQTTAEVDKGGGRSNKTRKQKRGSSGEFDTNSNKVSRRTAKRQEQRGSSSEFKSKVPRYDNNVGSDSESEVERQKRMSVHNVKHSNGAPKLEQRRPDVKYGGPREYSPLEDHAIVAWINNGARARRVNGNLVWRELEPAYPRLTGLERSWHSLRNRYLRHVLPALHTLALPPDQAARLRAAAHHGTYTHAHTHTHTRTHAATRALPTSGTTTFLVSSPRSNFLTFKKLRD